MNKKKHLKNLALFLAVFSLSFVIGKTLFHKNSSFLWICDISSHYTFNPEWEVPPPTEEEIEQVRTLLQQKFTYINCGAQSLAFLSEDGQFVLKFFKLHRRRLPLAVRILPLPSFLDHLRERVGADRQKRLKRDFGSYVIAYNLMREEAAIHFLHLNKTNYLKQQVTIIDKLGFSHTFDLDPKAFLIQRKVSLPFEAIHELMAKGEIETVKKRIASLLDLSLVRYKKGIFDSDNPHIGSNYGFDGEKAIFLDVGRLEMKPEIKEPEIYRPDFEKVAENIREWLVINYPSLVPYLDEKKNEACYFQ